MSNIVPKGTEVILIKLTGDNPAKLLEEHHNFILKKDFNCFKCNQLKFTGNHDPASKYIKKGYTVRSAKEDGYWYQICYLE